MSVLVSCLQSSNPPLEYLVGLGEAFYSFLDARFAIAYVGNNKNQSFVSEQGAADYKTTAQDFANLCEGDTTLQSLASRFEDLNTRFSALLASTTASDAGVNYVGSSDSGKNPHWSDQDFAQFVTDAQALSQEAWSLVK